MIRQFDELVSELGAEAPMWTDSAELLESTCSLAMLPALVLIAPGEEFEDGSRRIVRSGALPHPLIALLPQDFASWERPDMTVREMHPAAPRLRDLLEGGIYCG